VKFGDYADVIPQATRSELRRCFPSGEAAMWGIRPGQGNGPNQREYGKMRVGDTVLFYDHSRFFAAATVASLFPNPGLAERLWPRHPSGQIFEYMYALDEVRTLDLSYAEFNPIVGYKDMSRNVTVLDEARSQASSSACPWKAAASGRHQSGRLRERPGPSPGAGQSRTTCATCSSPESRPPATSVAAGSSGTSAGHAIAAPGRTYGKEKVYGSIP